MGSEGPPAVTFHVTGFKKFHGVSDNPTEKIVNNLNEYMKKNGLPKGVTLGSCTILETAGQGALVPLYQTLQSAVSKDTEQSNFSKVILVSNKLLLSEFSLTVSPFGSLSSKSKYVSCFF